MKAYVALTDSDQVEFLRARPQLQEVNFWQPSGRQRFKALQPGEPFLFKLHSPQDFVVGGGFFAASSLLPLSLVWEIFGEANGAVDFRDMKQTVERYRRGSSEAGEDYPIGCIILQQPFFFDEADWIAAPKDFSKSIVRGKLYDTGNTGGRALWEAVRERLDSLAPAQVPDLQRDMFGVPVVIRPRMGPGAFQVLVIDAYRRRCAVTGEASLPALEAACIRPPSRGGPYRLDNGLLLRADLRRLFERGYLTVGEDLQVRVSDHLERDFGAGAAYRELEGTPIQVPERFEDRPRAETLRWHRETIFRG